MYSDKFDEHAYRHVNSSGGGCFVGIIYIAIVVTLVVGYISNIIKLTRCDFEPSYKAETLYIVGTCVPPLGGIFGYCDFGK